MNFYLLFKALHLIAVISWFAGLLYLPRIFVYHAETKNNNQQKETFKVMEKKLFNYIMMPAMLLSWTFGIFLIYILGFSICTEIWMQVKMGIVFLLTYYHFYLGKCVSLFAIDKNNKTSKFYRIINEVPTIFLIIIIFLVIFKPL